MIALEPKPIRDGVVIRRAAAEDAPFLAQMMYDSTTPVVNNGLFDRILEGIDIDPVDFNKALILAGANNWGQLDSFIVAEEDGELVGACAAYLSSNPDRRPITPEGLAAITAYLGWSPAQSNAFWRKFISWFGFFGNLPQLFQPGDYVLEYTGIRADRRGRGLLQPILAAHRDRARAQGHKTMGVSVVIGNDPARHGYAKFGFEFHNRVGPEEYGGAYPGMDRFLLDL